jgi:hypothetical protein
MDDLVTCGVLAVALFYLIIAGIAAGAVYGLYILVVTLIAGNYPVVIQPLLIIGILALAYWGAGALLQKLGII